MRVCYLNLNVVDCTADPHILDYDAVEKMLDDVLKICESDVVRAINVVRLSIGKEYEVIEDRGSTIISEEEYESDYYTVPITKEEHRKVATGPYAKKHKVEGLVFKYDSPYEKRIVKVCTTVSGEKVKIVRGRLPVGLTGVRKAIEMIRERLKSNPSFRDFVLEIGVVWDEFGDHNCSDYIIANGRNMTVDYSNQDWYRDDASMRENYRRHLQRLAKVLGVKPEDLIDEW
jgi:hypothetical protein